MATKVLSYINICIAANHENGIFLQRNKWIQNEAEETDILINDFLDVNETFSALLISGNPTASNPDA